MGVPRLQVGGAWRPKEVVGIAKEVLCMDENDGCCCGICKDLPNMSIGEVTKD